MEDRARLGSALSALLGARSAVGTQPSAPPSVLASDRAEPSSWTCVAAHTVGASQIAEELRQWRGAIKVVVVHKLSQNLLGALREFPPPLLIVTGPPSPTHETDVGALADRYALLTLGPHAVLHAQPSGCHRILCATTEQELQRLSEVLGVTKIALSPTPAWLPAALSENGPLHDCDVVGYVAWEHLNRSWATWARGRHRRDVIVPLGVQTPDLDSSPVSFLENAVATQALETYTGPVYPAPRVLACIHQGPSSTPTHPTTIHAQRLWSQASRALPRVGGLVGMEHPLDGLDLGTPTAAFLAQHALLHMKRAQAHRGRALAPAGLVPEAGRTRSLEVLKGSGEVLSEHESKVVLRGYGIEITRQAVATSASGAANFAERIGYPVVLKAVSPDLRRKFEIGGVVLSLANAAAVKRAYGNILHNIEKRAPGARLDGIVVAEMIEHGQEIRCGGVRMNDGQIAFFGQPVGLPTTVDPLFAIADNDGEQALLFAHAILSRLPVPALRRATDPDVHTLARLFLALHRLFEDTGDRLFFVDLSPIRLVSGGRAYVTLDARIVQRSHLDGV